MFVPADEPAPTHHHQLKSRVYIMVHSWCCVGSEKRIMTCIHHFRVLVCAQSCPTLCNPMDCSRPGFFVRGISQARTLKWVAIPTPRDQTRVSCVSCIGRRLLYSLSHREGRTGGPCPKNPLCFSCSSLPHLQQLLILLLCP